MSPVFPNPKSLEDLRAEEREICAELDRMRKVQLVRWGPTMNAVRRAKNNGDLTAANYLKSRKKLGDELRGVRALIKELERK